MADDCSAGCVSPPHLFHTLSGNEAGAGIFWFDPADCSNVVARGGDALFGCPGDPPFPGAPPGSAGVGGQWPMYVRFSEPVSVAYGSPLPVSYLGSDTSAGIAASSAAAGSWGTGTALALTVGPAVGLLAALALAVALGVRWVRSIRSTV